jgi:AcrR family transcriptional regulator
MSAVRLLFGIRTFAKVSAEEFAAAAKVTSGAVYHQFANKRGVFVAVFNLADGSALEFCYLSP